MLEKVIKIIRESDEPKAEIINETNPLWKQDPKEITEDQYKEFYRKLYPMDQDPLFWIHLKIDHPFTLDGILYFPKINPNRNFNESHIDATEHVLDDIK